MKRVIRDYFAAFRWTKIKECYKTSVFGSCYFIVYMFMIWPALMYDDMEMVDAIGQTLRYLLVMIIMVYGIFAAPLHPVSLPKILYLCPMSEEERRDYLCKSYFFKVGFGMAITVIGVLVLIAVTGMNAAYGFFVIFAEVGIIICNGNVTDVGIRASISEKKPVLLSASGDVWDNFASIITTFIGLCLAMMVDLNREMDLSIILIILGAMIILELPLIIYAVKKIKPTIDAAVRYER